MKTSWVYAVVALWAIQLGACTQRVTNEGDIDIDAPPTITINVPEGENDMSNISSLGFTKKFTPPAAPPLGIEIVTNLFHHDLQQNEVPRSLFLQLQADLLLMGLPAPAQIRDLKARISWGSGNARFTADVDYIQGTAIELAGTSVTVDAVYRPLNAGSPSTFSLGGSLSFGTRPSSPVSPSFTTDRVGIANGATQPFDVPTWANDVRVWIGDPTATCRVNLLDDAGNTYAAFLQPASFNGAYPLPGNCASIEVLNNSGGANNFVVRYGLAL